ncbi:Hypothetical protein SRAE_X000191900 [Strongyloides ratti]|uniref:Uncharacterized protein n=1 Tax=Strongyloides ratti TaxID=34506 RepID=A0A090KRS7_STRRB|nr:Hypothetical protein SRAE_X000191900 [Strongyloides ratti]CEF60179.1 Hypothetical protein SRAE_X000191900 [Strongyloides ratti]
MYFIKYFVIFALFAIQLSVQKPNSADVITYEAYGRPGDQGYRDVTTFNELGSKRFQNSPDVTTYEHVVGPATNFNGKGSGIPTLYV